MDLFYVPGVLLKTSVVFSPLNHNGGLLIRPPKKINKTFYMCDKMFHLDQILEMYKDEYSNGIVFVSGKMYAFYKIIKTGNHLDIKKLVYEEDIPLANKTRRGGSSQNRYMRQTNESHNNYITKLSEKVIRYFMLENNTKYLVDKLIFAGPGGKKIKLAENDLVQQYFNSRIIIINTENINDEVINKTIQDTVNIFNMDEGKYYDEVINNIQELIINDCDKLVFGLEDIIESIKENKLEKIIIDEIFKENITEICMGKCELIIVPHSKMSTLGINIMGIKWY